jgi:hypothetical protein
MDVNVNMLLSWVLRNGMERCEWIRLAQVKGQWWSLSEIDLPGMLWNVALQRDGEDQFDRACEKWSIYIELKMLRISYVQWKKDNWIGDILHRGCLLQRFIEGKVQ